MSIESRLPETPAHSTGDERPPVGATGVCAPCDERECRWAAPWHEAAQNADWCIPEVR